MESGKDNKNSSLCGTKMKANVFVKPKTTKGKIIAILCIIVVLAACVPVINFFNKPDLVFEQIPVLFAWTICIVLGVIMTLRLALKWEVY